MDSVKYGLKGRSTWRLITRTREEVEEENEEESVEKDELSLDVKFIENDAFREKFKDGMILITQWKCNLVKGEVLLMEELDGDGRPR